MKTLKYIACLLPLALAVACAPMEDINNTLENEYSGPVVDDLSCEFTPADYKEIGKWAMNEATTTAEYKLAEKVGEDTVLYGNMLEKYASKILRMKEKGKYLGYGEGTMLTLTYNYAEAIGAEKVRSTQIMKVNGAGQWDLPAEVEFDIEKSDYQYITDYVKTTKPEQWESKYGGREIYYGTSPKYDNFDLRYSTRCYDKYGDKEGKIDPEIDELYLAGKESGDYTELEKLLDERVLEAMMMMMENKYAESGANIESKGRVITYKAKAKLFREGYINQYATVSYECTKASPNPTFKQLEVAYELE